jgi:methylthioribose-1-phosphate isomerase
MSKATVEALVWQPYELKMLDQRALPHVTDYLSYTSAEGVAQGIKEMVVRGAPAIGIAAAYGMAIAAHEAATSGEKPKDFLRTAKEVLAASRPTAVNLFWALERCESLAHAHLDAEGSVAELAELLSNEAIEIHQDDIARNRVMGELGAALLPAGAKILTHCNAGALATGGHGTALGIIRSAVEAGNNVEVWVDETRPYLQGARLTLYELMTEGIPARLVSDNMSGFLMSRNLVDAVIVGTDRTVANGDVANKIGTYTLAVLCARHKIPFYVACPLSTLDLSIEHGADIPIEERSSDEVTQFAGVRIAPEGAEAYHPAFDVTPAELVTAIITEKGIAYPPYKDSLPLLLEKD